MKTLYHFTMTLAVLYLLLRDPRFPGDALSAIGRAYELASAIGSLRTAEAAHPGELRIGPCNLSNDCREDAE